MKDLKGYVRFVLVFVISHTVAYLFDGGVAYQLITKEFWDGVNPLLSAYLRTPGNTDLWKFAMTWQIPAQNNKIVINGICFIAFIQRYQRMEFSKKSLVYGIDSICIYAFVIGSALTCKYRGICIYET